MLKRNHHFHLPLGYSAAGLSCGIKSRKRKDLALFFSQCPAQAAGIFTTNIVKAAPIFVSKNHLKNKNAQAILINSGCANACTGQKGIQNATRNATDASQNLRISTQDILLASTGLIGSHLPMKKVSRGIKQLKKCLGSNTRSFTEAAEAILTTDTRVKISSHRWKHDNKTVTLWGCAKGSGMIHPQMATLLVVLLTDASVTGQTLQSILKESMDLTLNRISIDGDTSTNDTAFLLANGLSRTKPIRHRRSPEGQQFFSALQQVCLQLSQQIASDGEGATKTIWVFVEGAPSRLAAETLARSVATSSLVKTAVHGGEPGWGRVIAALGKTGIPFNPNRISIDLGGLNVCRKGQSVPFSEAKARQILSRKKVTIKISLQSGKEWAHYTTCDFSPKYVLINAFDKT